MAELIRSLVCAIAGHHYVAISDLSLFGKVRARCERCGRVAFVYVR